jgi:hypothetical protein
MGLPLHARAAALAAALSTTAAIIVTMAEIGHPPPDGAGMLSLFLGAPDRPTPNGFAAVQQETAQVPVAYEMPQP